MKESRFDTLTDRVCEFVAARGPVSFEEILGEAKDQFDPKVEDYWVAAAIGAGIRRGTFELYDPIKLRGVVGYEITFSPMGAPVFEGENA